VPWRAPIPGRAFAPVIVCIPRSGDGCKPGGYDAEWLPRQCPACEQVAIVGHGRRRRQAHDAIHDSIVVRRGRCKVCGGTLTVLPCWCVPGAFSYAADGARRTNADEPRECGGDGPGPDAPEWMNERVRAIFGVAGRRISRGATKVGCGRDQSASRILFRIGVSFKERVRAREGDLSTTSKCRSHLRPVGSSARHSRVTAPGNVRYVQVAAGWLAAISHKLRSKNRDEPITNRPQVTNLPP
jgi:hypothetical protein